MHTIDIFFLVLAVIFTIIGIKRGFIGEIIRLVAMISGFFGAFLYYNDLSQMLQFIKLPAYIRNALCFTLLYVAIVLSFLSIGWVIKRIIHLTLLGWLDRLLGAILGLFKTLIIIWIICLSISTFNKADTNFRKSTVYTVFRSLPPAVRLSELTKARKNLKRLIDPNYKEKTKSTIKKVKSSVLN